MYELQSIQMSAPTFDIQPGPQFREDGLAIERQDFLADELADLRIRIINRAQRRLDQAKILERPAVERIAHQLHPSRSGGAERFHERLESARAGLCGLSEIVRFQWLQLPRDARCALRVENGV